MALGRWEDDVKKKDPSLVSFSVFNISTSEALIFAFAFAMGSSLPLTRTKSCSCVWELDINVFIAVLTISPPL